MAALLDHVEALGLLIQALGALLIGLLCLMLNRVVHRAALVAWARGWLSLGVALSALLIEEAMPATAAIMLPMYLFGEYLFGYWIIEGCAYFGERRWSPRLLPMLVWPLAVWSMAAPRLLGTEFRVIFLLQSVALGLIFATALMALAPKSVHRSSPGLLAMRVALVLLSGLFLSYVPIFSANVWLHQPLPLTWLRLSSAVHLALEFVLGFGGAVLVLEQSHRGLMVRNDVLSSDIEKFRGQAERDALTNAYNRHALLERLAAALVQAARMSAKVSLMYLDLDHFKDVNDSQGHAFGDQLLIAVAQRLQQCVGQDDLVVRMGGDEFIVMTANAQDQAAAARLAEKIKAVINEPVVLGGTVVRVQASVGIGTYPDDATTADGLLRHADIALYQAKADGRNTFRFFDVDMNQRNHERVVLTRALSAAIGTRQLFVEYQPLVDVASGRINALEALLRWHHPERGLISPADFIPLAEQGGLIDAIGEGVLREVCAQILAWQMDFVPLVPIAVNVSSCQFEQKRLADLFIGVIEEFDVDPALIRIEITETELMSNVHEHARTLRRLREFGIKVAIDDFGTGHSSLSYLKDLPIDCLKIDRSFISHMVDDTRDAAIVEAVIGISRSMGIDVVAEGVESAEQAARLRHLGCDSAQGFLYHRPMSPDRCRALLERPVEQVPLAQNDAPMPHWRMTGRRKRG